ncbi:MAG: hypothetical protein ACP5LF_02060 [Nitrososphaeria archaeon]|nr:hypothetical protein [Conexivisphaerales archaeon]
MIKLTKQINLSNTTEDLYNYFDESSLFSSLLNDALDISKIKGKQIIFTDDSNGEFRPIEGWGTNVAVDAYEIDVSKGRAQNLVAVDSSSISIAETEEGGIYAVKGGAYVIKNGEVMLRKLGPLAVYIGLSNIKMIESIIGSKLGYGIVIDKQLALKFVRNVVENMLFKMLINEIESGIALVDGSLKDPPFFLGRLSPRYLMEKHKDKISFIGISKGTSIKALKAFYSSFFDNKKKFVNITDLVYSIAKNEFGDKYLVKLDETSIVLRADIYHKDPNECFASLIKSDKLVKGYPESLIGAHLLSLFVSSEVQGIKALVAQNASKVLLEENMRKFLLGYVR